MPSADHILQGLETIAAEWAILAVIWHVFFGTVAVALVAGWRPDRRDLGLYLVLPLISVSALSWLHWNPFNGTAVAAIGLVLLTMSMFLGKERVTFGPVWAIPPGALLFAFGWGYPHFLDTDTAWTYLYRAPTSLIPCPTLAILAGVSMVFGAFGSRVWGWVLGTAGVFYGAFGAWYLGVAIDWILVAGSLLLIVTAHAAHAPGRRPSTDRLTTRIEPSLGDYR